MKWLNIGTNIAAIITALIALFTLVQIQKQNDFAHRADIVPVMKSPGFKVSYEENDTSNFEFISYDSLDTKINVILSNIGFGASRENKISWALDRESLDDTITINENIIDTKAFYIKGQGTMVNETVTFEKDEKYLSFILPISQEKKETIIKIPQGYVNLWLNALVRVVQLSDDVEISEKNINDFLSKFSAVSLKIEYEDILRNKYRKEFLIHLYPQYVDLESQVIGVLASITEQKKETKKVGYFIVNEERDFNNVSLELK